MPLIIGDSRFGLSEKERYADIRISLQRLRRCFREACLRVESGSLLREVRLEEDGEAHVSLRRGQVFKQFVIAIFERRHGLRRLLIVVLRGLQIAVPMYSACEFLPAGRLLTRHKNPLDYFRQKK